MVVVVVEVDVVVEVVVDVEVRRGDRDGGGGRRTVPRSTCRRQTDDEVDPTLVGLVESLPHEATAKSHEQERDQTVGFTVGSLARLVAIT